MILKNWKKLQVKMFSKKKKVEKILMRKFLHKEN